MRRTSAALVLYTRAGGTVRVLVGHMGGPFWAARDRGAWSIPKGELDHPDEDARHAARREFEEETGHALPPGPLVALGEFRQPSGKRIVAFALEGWIDATAIRSNTFAIEWPRGSGIVRAYPEIDRAEWLTLDQARAKVARGQVAVLEALAGALGVRIDEPGGDGPR